MRLDLSIFLFLSLLQNIIWTCLVTDLFFETIFLNNAFSLYYLKVIV
jgi:hypothetical protein